MEIRGAPRPCRLVGWWVGVVGLGLGLGMEIGERGGGAAGRRDGNSATAERVGKGRGWRDGALALGAVDVGANAMPDACARRRGCGAGSGRLVLLCVGAWKLSSLPDLNSRLSLPFMSCVQPDEKKTDRWRVSFASRHVPNWIDAAIVEHHRLQASVKF